MAPQGAARSSASTLAQPRLSVPVASGVNQAPSLIETTPGAMRSVTRTGSRVAPRCVPLRLHQKWGLDADPSGWTPPLLATFTPELRRQGTARARAEYTAYLKNFRLGGPTCRAVRALLELCRAEGIASALVLMPEGAEFQSWYPPQAWSQIQNFLAELSRDFAAPVINARGWVGEDQFADSHHLIAAGARRFSERLGREVVRPLLDPQTSHRANASVSDLTGSRRGMNSCPRKPL